MAYLHLSCVKLPEAHALPFICWLQHVKLTWISFFQHEPQCTLYLARGIACQLGLAKAATESYHEQQHSHTEPNTILYSCLLDVHELGPSLGRLYCWDHPSLNDTLEG